MITNFKKSDALSEKAQQLIPGGAHTYSKGVDQSPLLGPKVIAKGKGSHIWDIDGNEYLDWAMGLASISLGHAYEPVLEVVREELTKGVNFQCPSPIEIELAEMFVKEVPGAEMVKFAKNGSTATTAAIKLARAYTGKKHVAFCSDHGFFSYDDWYIGTKPNNAGVLPEVAEYSIPFKYNDIQSVEKLFEQYPNQIAAVILEPMEFDFPENDFLLKIQELCKKNETVFIIDEMITGFRLNYPGAYTMFGITPDLTTWGKGIANGFSTCMLAGRKEIMNLGGINHDKERVFLISTTHGAETHALAAAMAAIKAHKAQNSIERNKITGNKIKEGINKLIKDNGLDDYISIKGHPNWQMMQFKDKNQKDCVGFRTLVYQEAVKHGIFFRGAFVPTISHTETDVEHTIEVFVKIFDTYKKALNSAEGYKKFLIGEPIKPVFRKFN